MTQAVTWGPTMTVWWWWAKPCGKLSIQSTPLSCPDTLVIGHWNVRSMYRAGATEQVAREMEGYKLDILGISEADGRGPGDRGRKRWCWTWHILKRSEQWPCCYPWMEARGEEKQRQTQNNLALHCGEGERQTRMEHMGNSKTGSKQLPAVEGVCPCLLRLLARRDLTFFSGILILIPLPTRPTTNMMGTRYQ